MKISSEVKDILNKNMYMNLSTSSKAGIPWISAVFYSFDKNLNFYWYSPVDSKHSLLIQNNESVAISIYDSHSVGDDVSALFIEAKASVMGIGSGLKIGMSSYGRRLFNSGFLNSKQSIKNFINNSGSFIGNSPLRFYKAVPSKAWSLGESEIYKGNYVDRRKAIAIS